MVPVSTAALTASAFRIEAGSKDKAETAPTALADLRRKSRRLVMIGVNGWMVGGGRLLSGCATERRCSLGARAGGGLIGRRCRGVVAAAAGGENQAQEYGRDSKAVTRRTCFHGVFLECSYGESKAGRLGGGMAHRLTGENATGEDARRAGPHGAQKRIARPSHRTIPVMVRVRPACGAAVRQADPARTRL